MTEFIHERVDPAILALVPASMEQLVGPTPDAHLAKQMPGLAAGVEKTATGPMRECLRAGLWVLADDLDRAHRICQDVNTPHGAAWHAVVHRREGDFWNSNYWWRRAGTVRFEGLAEKIGAIKDAPQEILACARGGRYDPEAFVNLVERTGDKSYLRERLVMVQRLEWVALFGACCI